ncbi:Protein of unknown function [Gryllus bimaculatus]|nr:Protein of unknown function [Gryllus bimaculatus]
MNGDEQSVDGSGPPDNEVEPPENNSSQPNNEHEQPVSDPILPENEPRQLANEPELLENDCGPPGNKPQPLENVPEPLENKLQPPNFNNKPEPPINETASPTHAVYVSCEERLETFWSWPISLEVQPENLYKAGFFYTGKSGRNVQLGEFR